MSVDPEKIDRLVSGLPDLIKGFENWWYDNGGGPSLYFYRKTVSRLRESGLETLLEEKDYIELLYATLTAWDMDSRRAEMKDFEDFRGSLRS